MAEYIDGRCDPLLGEDAIPLCGGTEAGGPAPVDTDVHKIVTFLPYRRITLTCSTDFTLNNCVKVTFSATCPGLVCIDSIVGSGCSALYRKG